MKTRLSIPVIIQYLLAITSLLAAVSCEDKTEFAAKGDPIQISINARTKYSDALSRDILDNEINVTNYTFLYYVREEGVLKLKTMKDFLPKDLPASLIIECPGINESNLAILIANVTTESMIEQGLALNSDISALNNITYDVTRFDNDPDDAKKFTWSGYHEVKSDTRVIDFVLNPNVAKLKVTIIDNTSTESQVVNLRMKQVRNKVRYAQNALYRSGYSDESGVDQNDRGYVYYDMEGMELSKESGSTYSWYIPHNEPIHIPGKTYSRRSGDVPLGSTYLEIDGLRNIDFMCSAYRIYPGVSEGETDYMDLSNYNVIADYQYNITVTIHDDGMEYSGTSGSGWYIPDPGYKNLSVKVKLPGESNSYIIQPKVQNISDGKRVWELFPSERVNDYWGTVKGDASRTLTKYSKWKVEVIWQDINARALCFCNEYGEKKNVDYYIGEGLNPMYFTLDDDLIKETAAEGKNSTDDIYGNILIGLKLLDDNGNVVLFNDNNKRNLRSDGKSDYLWSWHLWVTDYNPDAAPAYTEGLLYYKGISGNTSMGPIDMQGKYYYDAADASYTEKLFDGNVQHYNSLTSFWTSKTPTATDVPSYPSSSTVWDSGLYAKKWIMDRNIGAQSPDNSSIENPDEAYGLYYQYGRKDPFSYKPIYDIDGTPKASKWSTEDAASSEGGLIKQGIQNPQKFFTTVGKTIKWDKTASDNDWFNPEWNHTETRGDKTLFDPCPPGWCIPVHEVFSFAVATTSNKGLDDVASASTTHSTVEVNVNNTSASNNYPIISDPLRGFCDLICTIADDDCKARYPLAGYIDGNSSGVAGSITGFTTTSTAYATAINVIRGCLWTLEHDNDGSAKLIQIQPTSEGLGGTTAVTYPISKRGRYYKVHYARLAIREWVTSRGQNVRCIQEP